MGYLNMRATLSASQFSSYSRIFLHEDFSDVIEEMLPAASHMKAKSAREAERKEKKARMMLRAGGRTGVPTEDEEKMKLMGNPQDRYEEGVAEFKEFFEQEKRI